MTGPSPRRQSTLRLALAQVNTSVGELAGNAGRVVEWAGRAAAAGADLVAFPEMTLTGYQVDDLALRPSFVAESRATLDALAGRLAEAGLGELVAVVGYLDADETAGPGVPGKPAGAPRDAMAVLHRGRVVTRSFKYHLPNFGVFDELRYFVPGDKLPVVRVRGVDVAIAICRDLWDDGGPVAAAAAAGAGLLVSINSSPFELGKDAVRLDMLRRRVAEAGCAIAYVNQVGGQDELVFDGASVVVGADGTELARGGRFTEELITVDLAVPASAGAAPSGGTADMWIEHTILSTEPGAATADRPPLPAPAAGTLAGRDASDDRCDGRCDGHLDDGSPEAEIYGALVLGLRDYVRKNGFRSVVLGLSGGIDSALTAAIAVDALGAENVHTVSMPSQYSSGHSRDDAGEMARRTGMPFSTVPIAAMVTAYLDTAAASDGPLTGLAEENLQARIRGMILMSLSNEHGHLVLATGNKSELAVGYSTLYGDAVGGFAPLKDVLKTRVWSLARWRNAAAVRHGAVPPIPENSIEKPPSAELRPDQLDTDSLPDYEVLDALLAMYVEQDQGRTALLAAGFAPELVDRTLRLVDLAEYKRRQYPPGTKVTGKAFGRDRRLPITSRWREQDRLSAAS